MKRKRASLASLGLFIVSLIFIIKQLATRSDHVGVTIGLSIVLFIIVVLFFGFSKIQSSAKQKTPIGSLPVVIPEQPLRTLFLSASPTSIVIWDASGKQVDQWSPKDISGKIVKLTVAGAAISYRGINLTVPDGEVDLLFRNRFLLYTGEALSAGLAALRAAGVRIDESQA